MGLEFNFPVGLIFFCFLLGIIYALVLYYRELKNKDLKKLLVLFVFLVRTIVISVLCILLLEPVFQHIFKKVEKPIIVFAQDDSESILMNVDSSYYKGDYQDSIHLLINNLEKYYDVHKFSFGNSINSGLSFDFDDKITALDNLFHDLKARYYGRNLGAIILASDGLINSGNNPIHNLDGLENTTFYAVSLGDTNIIMDARIQNILHNRIVSLGNDFSVEVQLLAQEMIGKEIVVNVTSENREKLFNKKFTIKKKNEPIDVNFILSAKEVGKIKYTVEISHIEGELTYLNNIRSFYVEVLENEQNILLLAHAPHPDIGAIKWVLDDKLNSKLEIAYFEDFNKNIRDYNLIIIHKGFKESSSIYSIIKKIKDAKIPILYITGDELNIEKFNQVNTGLELYGHKGSIDVNPVINEGFSNFILTNEIKNKIQFYPPLSAPFASKYKNAFGTHVLAFQKINSVVSTYPLITFNQIDEIRQGIILGEGFWRWKMMEYSRYDQASSFKLLFTKIFQFLSSNEKKDRFIIDIKDEYMENEAISFYGELYNENFELVNSTDLEIELMNDSNEIFQKAMLRSDKHYELMINRLNPGKYTYKASSKLGDENFVKRGSFIVHELKVEYMNAQADHNLLNNLVSDNNGLVVGDKNISELFTIIKNRNDIVNIIHHSKKVDDVVKWKWIFFIICFLISLEWLIRKRSGLY